MQHDTSVHTSIILQCQKKQVKRIRLKNDFPQLETSKPISFHRKSLKRQNIEEKIFLMKFSNNSHSAVNSKESSMLIKRFVSGKNWGNFDKNKLEKIA